MKKISFVFLIIWVAGSIQAQSISVPFDEDRWDTQGAEFVSTNFQGREAILLTGGTIVLKDVELLNGTIEVDINFSNRRNFPGVRFRMQDRRNYENFYIRPHQSSNPDANQYTPVFNGTAGWQLYHGEEWATPITYEYGVWHHIKIELSGSKAKIYFDNMEREMLAVDLLRDIEAGKIGLGTGIAPVYFANLSYTINDGSTAKTPVDSRAEDNSITQWQVSNLIEDSVVLDQLQLDKNFKNRLTWTAQQSEWTGAINLARYAQRSQGSNTIAVKVDIESDKAQLKRIDFGFSDRVRVYLNDQAIFEGRDRFVSRDYRYLGTIGFFDSVFLPLKKGKNELWFLVSEAFGGWGLQAKFENMEGVRLN